MYFSYISPSWRKKFGCEISFYPHEIGCYFWGGSCCAWIEVLLLSLRCSCRNCGAQAKIEVTSAPQSQHEHLNLGMSTAILAWAPQSWHEHRNPSIGAIPPISYGLLRGDKMTFQTRAFFSGQVLYVKKFILQKKWERNVKISLGNGRNNLPPPLI